MAQKTKPKQPQRAPAYATESLLVRLVVGAVLVALGLMIFLSVVMMMMQGNVFAGLRQVVHGLTGSLSFLLPVIPAWGGALVMISMHHRPRLQPFVMACVLYLLLMAALMLLSVSGSPVMPLMDYILQQNRSRFLSPDAFDAFLTRAYELGVSTGMGGGVLGMLIAWPLWKLLGVVGGAIVCILLAIVSALAMCRVTPQKVRALTQRMQQRSETRRQQRMQEQYEQELRWQQEQAWRRQQEQEWHRQQEEVRRQQAWEQQRMWAQQQQQQPPQEPYWQGSVPQQPVPNGSAAWNPYAPQEHPTMETMPPAGYAPGNGQANPYAPPEAQASQRRRKAAKAAAADGFQPADMQRPVAPMSGNAADEQPMAPVKKRKGIFSDDSAEACAPEQPAAQPKKRKGIFSDDSAEARMPEQPAEEPKKRRSIFDKWTAEPEQSAAQPSRRVSIFDSAPADGAPTDSASADSSRSRRGGVVRPAEKDMPPEAAPPLDTSPAASPRQKQLEASVRTAAHASPVKQKPLDSWAETPPWEDDPDDVLPPEVVQPVLQHARPQGAWEPELKLPPRKKEAAPPEQMEMTLPIPYTYPSMDLLDEPHPQLGVSEEEDALRTHRLEAMLESFRVPAKVRHITHGPTISRFELELAAGINVAKVTSLSKNIAMNMEVKNVRIEAPIPGTPYIGVEIPNAVTAMVTLREVLESEPMRRATKPLIVALGKDIAGEPILCDLAKMPHLLIAGATGAGKSVCINTIINSLLYRCSPEDVRLILVDPKVVELQCYNGIPHLLIPVVSDPHKASGALAWAVGEMMDRYKKFERRGVRNIDGYNANLEDGEEAVPRIVIIIDELADLMMTCKKDVEDRICRLAQLARAAGLHLIVATQRPSVDVITGLIKANINSRIAFKVNSNVDSRTILDRIGAENLLGYGDMLYKPMTESDPIRVQGCFLSDEEVNRITDFIRARNPAEYDPKILTELDHLQSESEHVAAEAHVDSTDASGVADSDQELLIQAIEMAVTSGQLSTSHLQRRLKLGYARAGRLMDEMEERGIVSQKDGAKPRRCLITREEFEQMRESGALEVL